MEGLRALSESGLGKLWKENEFLNRNIDFVDFIFEMYDRSKNVSKAHPIKKATSYMLVLTKGQIISHEYKPIPKLVYLEGAKYLSGFLDVSALVLIFECVAGNYFSFLKLRGLYRSIKLLGVLFQSSHV